LDRFCGLRLWAVVDTDGSFLFFCRIMRTAEEAAAFFVFLRRLATVKSNAHEYRAK
jgi:hypothetical protein